MNSEISSTRAREKITKGVSFQKQHAQATEQLAASQAALSRAREVFDSECSKLKSELHEASAALAQSRLQTTTVQGDRDALARQLEAAVLTELSRRENETKQLTLAASEKSNKEDERFVKEISTLRERLVRSEQVQPRMIIKKNLRHSKAGR